MPWPLSEAPRLSFFGAEHLRRIPSDFADKLARNLLLQSSELCSALIHANPRLLSCFSPAHSFIDPTVTSGATCTFGQAISTPLVREDWKTQRHFLVDSKVGGLALRGFQTESAARRV